MSAKIKDVAKKANVSIATVSRVINNVPLVNEETKEKVLNAIKETGYRPNAIARSLKLQKTETVGVIIHDITLPYYTQIARGVQDVSMASGYNAIICNSDADNDKEEEFADLFFQKQCDGIIFAGRELSDNLKRRFEYMNIPVILCGLEYRGSDYTTVVNDYETATFELLSYIKEKGNKSLAMIHGEIEKTYNVRKNVKVVKDLCEELGITITEIRQSIFNTKGGYEEMNKILKGIRPDVVLCGNDEMALGAMRSAKEHGLSIPDDIGIASLNSCEMGRWMSPSITSINHYMYDVGALSARILVKKLQDEDVKEKKVIVSHSIVKGESI